uniref:Copia protein n=1 Tax=Tanacetum cinerariifolium TaxID=118510 RepID=A0A6L2KMT9_TANCI|nr:copia protein [Tanacetum cinerariifolium]
MFNVCLCARFQEDPKTSHLETAKGIFQYIKGTTHFGLWYPKETGIETVVYADSDHARDYLDRKSTSGIFMFVGCFLTSWFLKKQTALAISTTKAECVSAEKACQQVLWMKQALNDYDVRLEDFSIMPKCCWVLLGNDGGGSGSSGVAGKWQETWEKGFAGDGEKVVEQVVHVALRVLVEMSSVAIRIKDMLFVDYVLYVMTRSACSSLRLPVPFPEDPYEAIRKAYLVETETPESPHTIASPTPLPDSTPPTRHAEEIARMAVRVPPAMSPGLSASIADVEAMSDLAFLKDDEEEDEEIEESLDSDSESEDAEDEGPTTKDEDLATVDGGLAARDEGPSMRVESLSLGGDAAVPEGQSSRSAPEPKRPKRVSALRQPTLTTWIDPEDDRVYIDIPTYPLPTPPVQTPPSLQWSSGSLPVSPAPSIVPLPVSSPMIPLIIPSLVASPATAKTEGFLTKLGARVEMQGGLIRDHTGQSGTRSSPRDIDLGVLLIPTSRSNSLARIKV